MEVLVVCTANQCRSPMAESLLRDRLRRGGVDARVSSAGVLPGGVPASGGALRAMADRGLDLGEHRSRQVTAELAASADLVLAMERRHLRHVVADCPSLWPRAFTLKELARRAAATGPRRLDEPLDDWLARVGAGRRPDDLLGAGDDDDVADPMGGPDEGYRSTAAEIDALLEQIVAVAFPAAEPARGDRPPAHIDDRAGATARQEQP